jgi:hypothetical protein
VVDISSIGPLAERDRLVVPSDVTAFAEIAALEVVALVSHGLGTGIRGEVTLRPRFSVKAPRRHWSAMGMVRSADERGIWFRRA